jgi:hypothetical protein
MAKLFLAEDESHYYIRASKSQGTFQISPEGISWLTRMQITLPRPSRQSNEGVPLTQGTFRKLKDAGYLYTKGYPSSSSVRRDSYELEEEEPAEEEATGGLPLRLEVGSGDQQGGWQIYLDLSDLSEETWQELQQIADAAADARLLAGPSELTRGISLRELSISSSLLLPVPPQAEAYQLCRQLPDGYQQLQTAPRTPGLSTDWQGTLFYREADAEDEELPRRRRRGESVKLYPGTRLYWLAKSNHDVERGLLQDWPGAKRRLASAFADWQLWELELTPAGLAAEDFENRLKRWLDYSELKLQRPHWSLQLLSPPLALPEQGPPVLGPRSKVIVGCRPPVNLASPQPGRAVAMTLDLRLQQEGNSSPLEQRFSLPGETSMVYVALDGLAPGAYQLWLRERQESRLAFVLDAADADEEAEAMPWAPELQGGLRCTAVTPGGARQEFTAFGPTAEAAAATETSRLLLQSAEEGAALVWELAPPGLPVTVAWRWSTDSSAGMAGFDAGWQRDRAFFPVTTGEQLTDLWQQRIWPALTRASQARLILDGGALGCLEILLEPAPRPAAVPLQVSIAQRAQLLWLSHCAIVSATDEPVPAPVLPAALQGRLRSLEQDACQHDPLLASALRRLQNRRLPVWVQARLVAILAAR